MKRLKGRSSKFSDLQAKDIPVQAFGVFEVQNHVNARKGQVTNNIFFDIRGPCSKHK
jgi:hypothetical protein